MWVMIMSDAHWYFTHGKEIITTEHYLMGVKEVNITLMQVSLNLKALSFQCYKKKLNHPILSKKENSSSV